jgi:hypothetical protein
MEEELAIGQRRRLRITRRFRAVEKRVFINIEGALNVAYSGTL